MIQILKYGEVPNEAVFARVVPEVDVSAIVTEILQSVRTGGDRAVLAYTEKFDKAALDSLEVTPGEITQAVSQVEPEFLKILEQAAENIRAFHSAQVWQNFVQTPPARGGAGPKGDTH